MFTFILSSSVPSRVLLLTLVCIVLQCKSAVLSGNIYLYAGDTWTGADDDGQFSGDGLDATMARFDAPDGIAVDASGNLFVTDSGHHSVRKIKTNGIVVTFYEDSGTPNDICLDSTSYMYIVEQTEGLVLAVNANGVLKKSNSAYTDAAACAVDSVGTVYVGDSTINSIFQTDRSTVVSGGTGTKVVSNIGEINSLFHDTVKSLYVGLKTGPRIYKLNVNNDFAVTVVAGTGSSGNYGDGGDATLANIGLGGSLCVDTVGNVFYSSAGARTVRYIDTSGIIRNLAGTQYSGSSGDGGPASSATFTFPSGIATRDGIVFVSDETSRNVRSILYAFSTSAPTRDPTKKPTVKPTRVPTFGPTKLPTTKPTVKPSIKPTTAPSRAPTRLPSITPTTKPSVVPSRVPSVLPTRLPSELPTATPTLLPTTFGPSVAPSRLPTVKPTRQPTVSLAPSQAPVVGPTPTAPPSLEPTTEPTVAPTAQPTQAPTMLPTRSPTRTPSLQPSRLPSGAPTTISPSLSPTRVPTTGPSFAPTESPTAAPVVAPSEAPSLAPIEQSVAPTEVPSPAPTEISSTEPTVSPSTVDDDPAAALTPTARPEQRTTITFDVSVHLYNVSAALDGNVTLSVFGQRAFSVALEDVLGLDINYGEGVSFVSQEWLVEAIAGGSGASVDAVEVLVTVVASSANRYSVEAWNEEALYDELSASIEAAFADGSYDTALHAESGPNGATETLYATTIAPTLVIYPYADSGNDDGLAKGPLAGVVIGSVAGAALLFLLIWLILTATAVSRPVASAASSTTTGKGPAYEAVPVNQADEGGGAVTVAPAQATEQAV